MFMTRFQCYCILAGRLMVCSLFVGSALYQIAHFTAVRELMVQQGMPPSPRLISVFLGLAIFLELFGSLLIALGLKVQFGALFLIAFLIPATTIFHGFWNFTPAMQEARLSESQRLQLEDPRELQRWEANLAETYDRQKVHFMKNVAIAGALLILMAFGAGPISLDARYGDGTGIPFRDEFGNPL